MASDPERRSRIVVIVMIIVAVGGSVVLSYFMHASSAELVRHLDSADPGVVSDSLILLKDRRDPEGISKAAALLKSDNAEVWTNAAIYLGAMEKGTSVPYLIKAMGNVEDDRKNEIVSELTAITGQTFGGDANAWRDWWLAQHPTGSFLFNASQTLPAASLPTALPSHPDIEPRAAP
ncbi:MAG: HEAT repeat domain-containing protein [Tepidisphaeraceae bacterium]